MAARRRRINRGGAQAQPDRYLHVYVGRRPPADRPHRGESVDINRGRSRSSDSHRWQVAFPHAAQQVPYRARIWKRVMESMKQELESSTTLSEELSAHI